MLDQRSSSLLDRHDALAEAGPAAAALGAAPDALVLVSRAVDVDMGNRPVQALRSRFHAERIEFVVRH